MNGIKQLKKRVDSLAPAKVDRLTEIEREVQAMSDEDLYQSVRESLVKHGYPEAATATRHEIASMALELLRESHGELVA